MLAAAAAEAVRNWHYQPYRLHDRPAQFQTDVTLTFALPDFDRVIDLNESIGLAVCCRPRGCVKTQQGLEKPTAGAKWQYIFNDLQHDWNRALPNHLPESEVSRSLCSHAADANRESSGAGCHPKIV